METDRIDIKILSYAYHDSSEGPVLDVKGRDRNNDPHVFHIFDMEHLAPRFGVFLIEGLKYIKRIKEMQLASPVFDCKRGSNSLYGEKTLILFTKFPSQVGGWDGIRDDFSWTFQADVKWEKMAMAEIIRICGLVGPYMNIPNNYMYKYLTLKDIKSVPKERHFIVKERICYWDIETDSREIISYGGYKDADISPIVSITTFDNYEEEYRQFVWHPSFKSNMIYDLENYTIVDNVNPENILLVKKIKRVECVTEKKMLCKFFEYFNQCSFDNELGYFSEGGYKKQGKRRVWVNGFDNPFLYRRVSKLGLLREIQQLSPFPAIPSRSSRKKWTHVYMRTGGKVEVVIHGVGQLDWIFSNEVLQVDQRYYDFRGSRLADWMAFFCEFNKLDKDDKNVWYYWEQIDMGIDKHLKEIFDK